MEPALSNGDWWFVKRTTRIAAGDVVLVVHPRRPQAHIVKRAVRRDPGGWWVLGDNAGESEDSRQFGVVPDVNIVGRLILRYRPIRRP